MKKTKTIFANNAMIKRQWYRIDADGIVLGRLATRVANYLRGKQKTLFTPQTDCGDYIVVVNAEKVKVTGNKVKDKTYFTHSGFPGGDRLVSFEKLGATQPEKIIRLAVRGMLPHNRLGAKVLTKLKIFRGEPKQYSKIPKLEVE
ncbi:MAG: 50S ribosomal protein L13 [Candidatus Margulisbacteria bacterium]|nr:50S ribosomal protein L13 [Candidatus Margulisiibacteriota bacterium]